jgi:hypothetical protein
MRSVEAQNAPVCRTSRKPVCTHCRDDNLWCDSQALCRHCSQTGDRCVYKLCRAGANCAVSRCVYIHPDQWNEQDPTWLVESGSLRPKLPDPRKRSYRPGGFPENLIDTRQRDAQGGGVRKRVRSPPGRDGYGDALEDGFIRKSICVHCFHTSSYCDFNGRCMTCKGLNVKCVRIHCKHGLSCRARKCPCVHPGQYDLRDTTWNVEHGDF